MSASFGIHFGATTACLAVCGDGKSDVIANDTGDRTTPAIVSFTNHDQAVGLAAKQGMIRNSANTVCKVKNVLGREYSDPEVAAMSDKGLAKVINNNGSPMFQVTYKEKPAKFSPTQIATIIYKKMMDTAESHGGIADSHDAVITVPLNFNQQQKEAIQLAASKAGFRVLRVLSEPAAACLAYDIGQNSKDSSHNKNVLVYRLGGSSMDVSVVTVSNGMYRIAATTNDKEIGGYMIDDLVLNYFAGEFKRQWKCDCTENKRSVMKLRNASENCKHILSTMPTTQCSVESLFEGIDFQNTLSRGRFEALCSSYFQRCLRSLENTLNSANMVKDDIHSVILCGGTTKIPSLQKQIKDYFPNAELLSSIPPDEVIAVGASKQASILSGMDSDILQRNVKETGMPSLAIDVLVQISSSEESRYATVLHRHTPVPTKRQQSIQLGAEQTSFRLHILGREEPTQEPTSLAKLMMDQLPAGSTVGVTFHVKGDGSLIITCHEPSSDKSEHITVETAAC